jgi:glutamate-ammonia-ligase adenylyltransferase
MSPLEDALASRDEARVKAALAGLAPGSEAEPAASRAALALASRRSPAGAAALLLRLSPVLGRAASASEALVHLLRALEGFEGDLAAIPDVALERAWLLAGLGGAPAETLVAHPEDIPHLEAVTLELPGAGGDDRLTALRTTRRRHTLAVAAAELAGALATREAASALSAAADLIIDATLACVRATVAARLPAAADLPLAVLALGKLGGSELNYSSDVDLVLVRGDAAPAEAAEAIARAFVRALEEPSPAGRLYRTDLRLRPEGSTGALAPRLAGAVEYYRRSGRTWERQAFVKARAAAGDRALGAAFLAAIEPFIWRAALDARGIEEIVALRAQMEAKAAGPLGGANEIGEAARNVKEGPGGIRDVEYCVQFLQLLRGGADPSLRVTGTLEGITRLEASAVVRAEEARALRESYGFLRRIEHALQLTRDRELKQVPRDPEARARLARALGFQEVAAFDARLAGERERARGTLDALLRKPFAAARSRGASDRLGIPAPPPVEAAGGDAEELSRERVRAIRDLVLNPGEKAAAHGLLRSLGFRDPDAVWQSLDSLALERSPYLAPSGRARTLLAGLAPRLLEALGRAPDPDAALRNLERATATLGAKATFYELLLEADDALELFCALAAASDFLVEALARRPGVFDEVVDRLLTGERPSREAIVAEAEAALARDDDAAGEALRDVRAVHLLLVGIRDVSGRANVQNTGRDLAVLAEAFLEALLARARRKVEARHGGPPVAASGKPVAFAALALGKLGAYELSYSSDLDLLFVIEGHGAAPDGAPAEQFFEEVAREAVRLGAGSVSAEGPLYPIDLRLRPAGGRGQLASTLEAARRYYSPRGEGPGEHAALWERLALQKLRATAGDRPFADEAAAALRDEIYASRYGLPLRDAVLEMRARQVEATTDDDLKRAPGGLADIEFLASALGLEHGGALVALRETNTARLLTALRDAGIVGSADHLDLMTAYQFLRRVELRLRVAANRPESRVPREREEARSLAVRLGYVSVGALGAEEQLMQELGYHRKRVRAVFERVLGAWVG